MYRWFNTASGGEHIPTTEQERRERERGDDKNIQMDRTGCAQGERKRSTRHTMARLSRSELSVVRFSISGAWCDNVSVRESVAPMS